MTQRANPQPKLWTLVAILWLLVIGARMIGPSDLWDKEQPRTIAYTVDMIRYGHFILPYDAYSIPATKPPLYNWVNVPFVLAFGYGEWVHKIPAILSSGAVLVALFFMGKHMQPRVEGGATAAPWTLGGVASAMWLASPATIRLAYVARPDMPLVALLTGAWAAATVMINSERSRPGMGAIFWFCTLGAALDKGPLALFALGYLLLAALLIRRDWRVLLRTGWWWGLPLVLIGSFAWLYAAYRQEPEYVQSVLLGHEVGMRFDWLKSLKTAFNSPTYPITGFFPWSLLVIGVLCTIRPRKWFSHPLAPAFLWVFIIIIGFAFTAHRRRDWYAPVFPQMAVIGAVVVLGLVERTRWKRLAVRPGHVLALASVMIVSYLVYDRTSYTYGRTAWGDHTVAFANDIRKTAGSEPVIYLDGERTGLEALMGVQQMEPRPADLLANAVWCVKRYDPADDRMAERPVTISDTLYDGEETEAGVRVVRLALYRMKPGEGTEQYAAHQRIPLTYDPLEGISLSADGRVRKYARFWRDYGAITGAEKPRGADRQ